MIQGCIEIISINRVIGASGLWSVESLHFLVKASETTRLEHSVTGAVFRVASKLSIHAPLEQLSAIL